jgi:putative ABC transport system permease protein
MLYHYMITAWRSMRKHSSFSLINILGLAASMSTCLLIILIIADQDAYDQFHPNKDRIYRVHTLGKAEGMKETASSALPLAEEVIKHYPGAEATAALVKNIGGDVFYSDKIASGGGYFADENLFKVLHFPLSDGDPATALSKPFSLVISQTMATHLFKNEDPIGKTVRFTDKGINPAGPEIGNKELAYGDFTITGVLGKLPGKTSLPFELLASLNTLPVLTRDSILNYPPGDWNNIWSSYTYVLMEKGKTKADLQRILDQVSAKHYAYLQNNGFYFKAEALLDIMPGRAIGNSTNTAIPQGVLLFLSILCLIIILSACLNYTNLSLARSLTRVKEVGIRKVSGASRQQVFTQFITESVIVSLVALAIGCFLLLALQPLFSNLWLNRFFLISFEITPGIIAIFLAFSLAVGLIAGLLPAIYISLFNPIQIIKSISSIPIFQGLTLRKILLVVQFTVSLIFIVSASLIYAQTMHIFHFNYGFNKDNVINVKLYQADNYLRFAQAVSANPHISAVSACSYPPSSGTQNATIVKKSDNTQDSIQANYIDIDRQCLAVWDLKLVAGKNLPEIPGGKNDQYILINERMVKALNYSSASAAISRRLLVDGNTVEIVGVVRDFQFLEVNRGIEPLMLRNRLPEFGYATIRIRTNTDREALALLQASWKKVNPNTKFEYEYFDSQLRTFHSMLKDAAAIIGFLALLAVLVACLGLLGMAVYTAETRQKEVGVRKVLGSGMYQLMMLLSKNYVVLLLIAILIATPLAYLLNNFWLQFFVSRVSFGAPIFLFSTGLLSLVSLLIVVSQAWRVSRINPVRSLRVDG